MSEEPEVRRWTFVSEAERQHLPGDRKPWEFTAWSDASSTNETDEASKHTHTYAELRRDAENAYHQMLARCGKEIDPDVVLHSGMFFAEVDKMFALIRELAETDSTRYLDNQGVMECPFCNGNFLGWGSRTEHIQHEADCVVVKARALMEGK